MAESNYRERELQMLANFRMFDDTFMSAVFDGQIAETELLLHIVLGQSDIEVVSSKAQFAISNIYGREARLDILARDSKGKAYNVEVQRLLSGASVKRARFNGALVDTLLLQKGDPHDLLPDRYTIFITEQDMFGLGLPAYHAQNMVKELQNAPLNDGAYIVYINGQYRNTDTPIGSLMHDFFCTRAEDMLNPLLRERVKYLKESEGGQRNMCQMMEEFARDAVYDSKIELARDAIRQGKLSLDMIAEVFHIPLSVVEELALPQSA